MIDAWNPDTFGAEITSALSEQSDLILAYYQEDRRLLDEHLNSSPYQSLQPNRFYGRILEFHEKVLTPLLAASRIRAWHYTRLTDGEVIDMERQLVPSSLEFLRMRLEKLKADALITDDEAEKIYLASPFQTQTESRANRIWTTVVPLPPTDSGVLPLLEHWGGESSYFWLSSERITDKLKRVGAPRILEIETALSDNLNAFRVGETVLNAWARHLGEPNSILGCDLAISKSISSARVLRIHTEGEGVFAEVAENYPEGAGVLLKELERR